MVLVSIRHTAYRRTIRSSVSPPQANPIHRPTISSSVFNNQCTVGSSKRRMARIRQGRRKPLDIWSAVLSSNIWDAATAANSRSTK